MTKSDIVETALSRLHPISIVYFLARTLKELYAFLPIIPVIAVMLNQLLARSVSTWWLSVFLVVFALLVLILLGWYRWRQFGYRIEHKAIYIEHGLWIKKKMWLFHDRIQSLNTTQRLYDRLFGLLSLQVETAGGDEPEMVLSSITATEATRIRAALGFGTTTTGAHGAVHEQRSEIEIGGVKKISSSELLLHSIMPGKHIYVLLVLAGVIFNLGGDWLQTSQIWRFFQDRLGSAWIVVLIVTFIMLSWITAILLKLLDDYGFTLESSGNKLIIARGLLERKHITLTLERIQAIHLVEHPLHRPLGYVSILAVTAGSTEKDEKTITLFPIVRKEEVAITVKRFAPAFAVPENWNGVEAKTIRPFVVVPVLVCLVVALPAVVLIPWHLGWLAMLLPILVLVSGWMEHKQMGWSIADEQVAIRYGGFSQHRAIIPKRRIQWHQMSQTPFQERSRWANLEVALVSGKGAATFTLQNASLPDVELLMNELTYRKKTR